MRAFAEKLKATQRATSPEATEPTRSDFGHSHEVNSILFLQRTIGNQAVLNVQVRKRSEAADSAEPVDAGTPTVGRHIQFGTGALRSPKLSGRRLMARKAAHASQLGGSTSTPRVQRFVPQPWTPPIRSEELGPGGTDLLGNRTFEYGIFSIFVPAGAASVTANHVHVFFSPGDVTGGYGGNAVAVHGLRGAADSSHWILIGVPGVLGGHNTISDADIITGLRGVGRAAQIDSLRLSAHSRGAAGLAASLQRRTLTPSLIEHVTVLDASDHPNSLTQGFQRSHVPPSRVTAYNVNFGRFSPYSVRAGRSPTAVENIRVDPICIRSIGYARLIHDSVATGRAPTPLPPGIASRVRALTLPPRGSFSSHTPAPPGKISMTSFCADPANQAALTAMRDGEPSHPTGSLSWSEKGRRAPNSPYAFIEYHNLMGFNDSSMPRSTWYSFNPQIYRHHLFVAEIAHELF